MKKIPLQYKDIIIGDILWDDLTFSKKLIYGNYYQIIGFIDVGDNLKSKIIYFNIYDKNVNFIEEAIIQPALFKIKSKDRIYKIEFETIQERAKFLLLMNTSS